MSTIRQIVNIDEERCQGCGLCVQTCHEKAIALVDGKAVLMRDDLCDGMGLCLQVCPAGALSFENQSIVPVEELSDPHDRHASEPAYGQPDQQPELQGSPPFASGTNASGPGGFGPGDFEPDGLAPGFLKDSATAWPVQLRLIPVNAPHLDNADLLIAADCSAFVHPDFHRSFVGGRVVLIGCPKLDAADYALKLTEIFQTRSIRSVLLIRMEVPCCSGLEKAVSEALHATRRNLPFTVGVMGRDGALKSTPTPR